MHRARLDAYLDATDLASMWFVEPEGFAWLTGGDSRVVRGSSNGVAAAGYDGDEVTVVAPNNEADRLRDEELPDDAVVVEYPWFERDLGEAIGAVATDPAAADVPISGFERFDPTALRQPLTDAEMAAYRDVGRRTAAAVESVCDQLEASDTEGEVAAALSIALSVRELDASVVLVGGSERAQAYRHYTPGEGQLGDYALVSVTVHDEGLYASCTRTVAFDEPDWLRERHRAAARVEATAIAATAAAGESVEPPTTLPEADESQSRRADGTAADVFEAIQDAYDAVGWPDEWREHHQGGAAGYAGREWIATPTSTEPVHVPQAYAWNPTIQGAKSEGTVLIDDDEIERLTTTGDWPTIEVDAVGFDRTLERPAITDV